MAEAAKNEEKKVIDEGLERGAEKLTEDQIEKVINRVIKKETGARLKAYVETCIHCGLCSEACHYYLSHDNDPRFSPVGKVKQTLWEMLKKKGQGQSGIYQKGLCNCFHGVQLLQALCHVLPLWNRHCLPDAGGAPDLSSAGCNPPLHSGHRPQPCRHHESDVGQR